MTYDKISEKHFGTCPFCHCTVDAFSTDNKTSTFFCYACGSHGDKKEFLAKMNIRRNRTVIKGKDALLLQIYEDAACFYYEELVNEQNPGISYLKSRGFRMEEIQEYGLGFAPDSFNALYKYLIKQYTNADLMRSGLFSISKKGYPYDFFRNRVVFPIMDENGDVIAFGGRVMDDSKPKYINSPETEIFSKRNNLYGFPYDSEFGTSSIIICEGYMDYIAIHNAGFANCAATLGTAMTLEHAKLIKEQYDEVYLAMDSDGPGIYAMKKSIAILKTEGIKSYVLNFKPAKDPDEMLRSKAMGLDAFRATIANALPASHFLARNTENISEIVDILMQQV